MKQLEKAIYRLMIGKDFSFYAPLVCATNINYSDNSEVTYAATDGDSIFVNKEFYYSLPADSKETLLRHEIEHIARLHHLRQQTRDVKLWNIACDYAINRDLKDAGYSFKGLEFGCISDKYPNLSEEEIYDILEQDCEYDIGFHDLLPMNGSGTEEDFTAASIRLSSKVASAVQSAIQAGKDCGKYSETLNMFLTPLVPWQQLLRQFFVDLGEKEFSWRKRNRRFPDMYMPSYISQDNKLISLNYYIDVSGSITTKEAQQCTSELKYIWQEMEPEKLTVIQFDTEIQKEDVLISGNPFNSLEIIGRGGTSLDCVHKHITDTMPTCAVIFSDLRCDPMNNLPYDVPVLWIIINNPDKTPPFGKAVHISIQ